MSGFTKYNPFDKSFNEDANSAMVPITEAQRRAALEQLDEFVNETRQALEANTED